MTIATTRPLAVTITEHGQRNTRILAIADQWSPIAAGVMLLAALNLTPTWER